MFTLFVRRVWRRKVSYGIEAGEKIFKVLSILFFLLQRIICLLCNFTGHLYIDCSTIWKVKNVYKGLDTLLHKENSILWNSQEDKRIYTVLGGRIWKVGIFVSIINQNIETRVIITVLFRNKETVVVLNTDNGHCGNLIKAYW